MAKNWRKGASPPFKFAANTASFRQFKFPANTQSAAPLAPKKSGTKWAQFLKPKADPPVSTRVDWRDGAAGDSTMDTTGFPGVLPQRARYTRPSSAHSDGPSSTANPPASSSRATADRQTGSVSTAGSEAGAKRARDNVDDGNIRPTKGRAAAPRSGPSMLPISYHHGAYRIPETSPKGQLGRVWSLRNDGLTLDNDSSLVPAASGIHGFRIQGMFYSKNELDGVVEMNSPDVQGYDGRLVLAIHDAGDWLSHQPPHDASHLVASNVPLVARKDFNGTEKLFDRVYNCSHAGSYLSDLNEHHGPVWVHPVDVTLYSKKPFFIRTSTDFVSTAPGGAVVSANRGQDIVLYLGGSFGSYFAGSVEVIYYAQEHGDT